MLLLGPTSEPGADQVDVGGADARMSDEAHPVAVAHAAALHLGDLVVAAEPVSDLKQAEK